MNQHVLSFNFSDRIWEYVLPAQDNRRIKIDLGAVLHLDRSNLQLEVWEGHWHILSNREIRIFREKQWKDDWIIKNGEVVNGKILAHGIVFSILIMELDEDKITFQKYNLAGIKRLTIGSGQNCDIQIENNYVSKLHATLQKNRSNIVLTDNSVNGVYVNGERIKERRQLRNFDEIYLVGIKLIFLGEVLAINRSSQIHTQLKIIQPIQTKPSILKIPEDKPFSRAPRTILPIEMEPIEIEAPPSPQQDKRQPMIFVLGPTLTMPLPILVSVLFNANRNAGMGSPSMYFSSLIAVGMSALIGGGWALARHFYDRKSKKQDEKQRIEAYEGYIEDNRKLLEDCHKKVQDLLSIQYRSTQEIAESIEQNPAILWDRNVNHFDFLTIRLGKGMISFPGVINIPKKRFSICHDTLAEKPYELYEQYRYLHNGVVCFSLQKYKLIGMIGQKAEMMNTLRNIVLQAAALHSYTDLKICFLYSSGSDQELCWTKWLPHTFTVDRKIRLISNDSLTQQNVLYQLTEELRSRDNTLQENENKDRFLPYFLVVCMSPELLNTESVYKYMVNETSYGFTFLLPYGELDQLPNECKTIIECTPSFSGRYLLTETRRSTDAAYLESVSLEEAQAFSKKLSRFYVRESAAGEIPTSIEFLEMYGLANVEQWDLIRHWKENRTYESMRAFIGIKSDGKPMYLDIHEKQHGPHGLVAGTTGSGKSETLQTYILSLVMNYHPDELALILIDYKGGGMANAFQGLVHVAGTITNLDGGQTRRALISIKSENLRRQTIFGQYNVNHIDQYARLYREGKAAEPLPHLVIISDEFAELKKEQPEFIRQLVSTARVGRSLGVHLILATQKPSGVVDDQIWSNSRFKLCLHVQDRQDSNEMLHRPDAAYLTNTGRGYLQIGNDELFELFQAGYSGAEYVPRKELLSLRDTETVMIGVDGADAVTHGKKKSIKTNVPSQLAAMVSYISKVAKENRISTCRQLWLPPLPEQVDLTALLKLYPIPRTNGINAVYGLVDDPVNQDQHLAILDFEHIANLLIIGLPGSGKSTLLQTILYSMTSRFTPEQINYYCLDFSGHLLNVFEKAPHCGGIIFSNDEERVKRLLSMLEDIMQERSRLFQQIHVGSYSEYQRAGLNPLPMLFVILDNYIAFSEQYEIYEEAFSKIARDGLKCGIHIIVAMSHANDMRYKLRQNFTTAVPLTLAERSDYGEVLGKMPEFIPASNHGRGMILEGELLEYQAALPIAGETEKQRGDAIKDLLSRIKSNSYARKIPVLPQKEIFKDFCEHVSGDIFPIGYDRETIEVVGYNKAETYCIAISGSERTDRDYLLWNLADYACWNQMALYLIQLDRHSDSLFAHSPAHIRAMDADGIFQLLVHLREEFKARSDARKAYRAQQIQENWDSWFYQQFNQILIVIDDMAEFTEIIYGGKPEDMSAIMEVFLKQGQGLGIYFVAGFDASANDKSVYTTMVKNFLNYKTGIHFGGHLDQQKLFTVNLPLREQSKPMEQGYGYFVSDNSNRIVFVPRPVCEEQDA